MCAEPTGYCDAISALTADVVGASTGDPRLGIESIQTDAKYSGNRRAIAYF